MRYRVIMDVGEAHPDLLTETDYIEVAAAVYGRYCDDRRVSIEEQLPPKGSDVWKVVAR